MAIAVRDVSFAAIMAGPLPGMSDRNRIWLETLWLKAADYARRDLHRVAQTLLNGEIRAFMSEVDAAILYHYDIDDRLNLSLRCRHCGTGYSRHANGKCGYTPYHFEARPW